MSSNKDPEERRRRQREYYRKNRQRRLEQNQAWLDRNPGYKASRRDDLDRYYRKSAYKKLGYTIAQYEALVEYQGGSCAICGELCSTGKRLALDHCHSTGVVRGALCRDCNTVLGKFRDSAGRFRSAAAYLDNPPALMLPTRG